MRNWMKNNWKIVLVGLISFSIGWWFISCVMSEGARQYWFATPGNHFQWVGISAVAAGIGLFITALDNRRKIKADLISKSRVEWMKQTREILADILVVGDEVISLTNDTLPTKSTTIKIRAEAAGFTPREWVSQRLELRESKKAKLQKAKHLLNFYLTGTSDLDTDIRTLVNEYVKKITRLEQLASQLAEEIPVIEDMSITDKQIVKYFNEEYKAINDDKIIIINNLEAEINGKASTLSEKYSELFKQTWEEVKKI